MARALDPVARAYATIGLRPGATTRELKQQYKRLAKKWHPDKWATDPVSQAEASQRMRAINDAYQTLYRELPGPPDGAAGGGARRTRPLTEAERDAIINAIGNDSPVIHTVNFLAWFAPLVAGVLPLAWTRVGRPPTHNALVASVTLVATGVVVFLFQHRPKFLRR